jgi:hypothetical protein
MHIVEVRRPLGSLSSSGEGRWWAGPRDCREELEELAGGRSYDSVFVLWPSAPDVALCGWGCTVGASDATFGAGFTSIATDQWQTLATDPDPEQGYVHEWLHQVEAVYRRLGLGSDELPGLHDAAAFTSTRPTTEPPFGRSYAEYHDGTPVAASAEPEGANAEGEPTTAARGKPPPLPPARTWAAWYRDWMTGRLRPLSSESPNRVLGLTPERWAIRSRDESR